MEQNKKYDYLEPIEVAKGIYWIGFHDERAALHCNPYLLIDGEEAVIFDPAGVMDYPKVASKIFTLIEPGQVSYIVLHHQDPDLCACVPLLEDIITNKQVKIVTHSRASILIRHYGVKNEFYDVDANGYSLTLKSGRKLNFMCTPFCHFPAAIVTYDEKEKVLFSSDIFGAISADWNLFAKEGYEKQMESFHVGYMASSRHLRSVMEKVEKMELQVILPQHGSIIRGEMIGRCINTLKALECGIDSPLSEEEKFGWIPK